MIVGSCFDGDVDMALAGVQHDLYFKSGPQPDVNIDGGSTLWWIWAVALSCCINRGHPWLNRNFERMQRIHRDGFSHKLLQIPHEHIAAHFRWTMPRVKRPAVILPEDGPYPVDLLEAWKAFLRKEIPELLSSDDALLALAKSMVYLPFEDGEGAYRDFQDVLMRRYGFECVERTGWAADVARRVGLLPASAEPAQLKSAPATSGHDDSHEAETYGCPKCWPDSADAAWEAGLKTERRHQLVDESHFHVMTVACDSCGQLFLWVFSELIDWDKGDDSQGWIRIPLAADEERNLRSLPEDAVERVIYGIGEDRRSLWRIHPRGMTAGCSWGLGVVPLPHD